MSAHRQRLDVSPALVLAVCTCGWREPYRTETAAWEAAADHARAAHDDPGRALDTLSARRRRAAS